MIIRLKKLEDCNCLNKQNKTNLKKLKCLNEKSKYKSKKTIVDKIIFQSKLEANYYCYLKILKKYKKIKLFLRQVPFDLYAGIKYKVDFLVFHNDGFVDFIDTKGCLTKEFIMKKKMVEELYPIKIKIVKDIPKIT